MKIMVKYLILMLLINSYSFSQIGFSEVITHTGTQYWSDNNIDTNYLGAGIVAKDSTEPILVIKPDTSLVYKFSDSTHRDKLKLMDPYNRDSSILVFDTTIGDYPDTVNIGKYKNGTSLVFMYQIKRSSNIWPYIKIKPESFINMDSTDDMDSVYKMFYTGQNRNGIDYYVSDRFTALNYSNNASAMINDSVVFTGFAPSTGNLFHQMNFKVVNAQMTGIDIFKANMPRLVNDTDFTFADSITAELYVPYKGNLLYELEDYGIRVDTFDYRPDSTAFKIFYTTDGTDPSDTANATMYNGEPIVIKETTTLKAIGTLLEQPDSVTFYPSEVVTWEFTEESSSVKPGKGKTGYRFNDYRDGEVKGIRLYDIRGRMVYSAKDKDISNLKSAVQGIQKKSNGLLIAEVMYSDRKKSEKLVLFDNLQR